MIKNKLSTYFVVISIATFITVFVLIVQKSYSNLITTPASSKNSNLIKPIDLNLDINTVDEIEKKENIQ